MGEIARVSLIIPALNEAQNLPAVLQRLPAWLHEVIIVDGGSTDGTAEIAQEHCRHARVVCQTGKGKGQALRDGFLISTGNFIVVLDADGSMDPAEIGRFVAPLLGGCHVVKGSRVLPGGASLDLTPMRRFGNWLLRSAANTLHGTRYSDLCYGYFSFVRGTIDLIGLEADGFEVEAEIAVKASQAGLIVAEVPSRELARASGTSKLRAVPDGLRILRILLKRHKPAAVPTIPDAQLPAWSTNGHLEELRLFANGNAHLPLAENGNAQLAPSRNGNGHAP